MNKQIIPLDDVRIASPCSSSWEEMTGNDSVRFCGECSLNVYNLSEMTRAEAESVLEGAGERLCVRIYQRSDGTVITRDCPVGMSTVRQRMLRSIRAAGATALTLVAGFFGLSRTPAHSGTLMGGKPGGGDTSAVVDTTEVDFMMMGEMTYVEPIQDTTSKTIVTPSADTLQTKPDDVHMMMGGIALAPQHLINPQPDIVAPIDDSTTIVTPMPDSSCVRKVDADNPDIR